jgi:hypothetical protein
MLYLITSIDTLREFVMLRSTITKKISYMIAMIFSYIHFKKKETEKF